MCEYRHAGNHDRVLHFVNHRCHFMTCFEHVLGRYSKQAADDRTISACLVAWATNMGLGRMGDISDITFGVPRKTFCGWKP